MRMAAQQDKLPNQATCSPAQPPATVLTPQQKPTTLTVSKHGKGGPPILALAALTQWWPFCLPCKGKDQRCGFGFFRFSLFFHVLFVCDRAL